MKLKKYLIFFYAFFFLFMGIYRGNSDKINKRKIAENSFTSLKNKDFTHANLLLSDMVKNSLKYQNLTLKGIWKQINTKYGRLVKVEGINTKKDGNLELFDFLSDFEHSKQTIRIVIDNNGKIVGFFILPSSTFKNYSPPKYVNKNSFFEKKCVFGKKYKLNGILTIPKGKGPFPAIILVHGSGPLDMDETVGKEKPFKDIAWGLASKKIAVFRYNKRTKEYPGCVKSGFTVYDETIEDVLFAIDYLSREKEINKKEIFILGHSLGATLLPKIATLTKQIKGIILLAPTSKGFYAEIMPDQLKRISLNKGKISKKVKEQIKKTEDIITKIKEHKFKRGTFVLGAPVSYWYDLLNYNPIKTLKQIKIPVLILWGEKDYHISKDDFKNWEIAFKNSKNVTIKKYPDLNHLFMYVKGKSGPENYLIPSNVDKQVIEDIFRWILKNK